MSYDKPDLFSVIDLGQSKTDFANILFVQPHWHKNDWNFVGKLGFPQMTKQGKFKCKKYIEESLRIANQHKFHVIVFPEYSIPQEFQEEIGKTLLTRHSTLIFIAGSYIQPQTKKDVCPIFISNRLYFTEKKTLTREEGKYGLIEGDKILVFDNSIIGKFAVLICKDAVAPTVFEDLCRNHHDLDFVFVPSMQETNSSANQHTNCDLYCGKYGKSYIFYCNNYLDGKWEGKSAIFGEHNESEYGGDTDSYDFRDENHRNKIAQLKPNTVFGGVRLNTLQKSFHPITPRSFGLRIQFMPLQTEFNNIRELKCTDDFKVKDNAVENRHTRDFFYFDHDLKTSFGKIFQNKVRPDVYSINELLKQCFSPFVFHKELNAKRTDPVDIDDLTSVGMMVSDGAEGNNNFTFDSAHLSSLFLNRYYLPPSVIRKNLDPNNTRIVETEISYSAFTDPRRGLIKPYMILKGDVGEGKSLFVSKLFLDLQKQDYYPVILDAEEFKNELLQQGYDFDALLDDLTNGMENEFMKYVYRQLDTALKSESSEMDLTYDQLIRRAIERSKKTVILLFDNLDVFHYEYERYCFFDEKRCEAHQKFISRVSHVANIFNRVKQLNTNTLFLSLFCVRPYTYKFIASAEQFLRDESLVGLYSLSASKVEDVIRPRIRMLKDIVEKKIMRNKDIKKGTKAIINQLFNTQGGVDEGVVFETLNKLITNEKVFETLYSISGQGYRSIIDFYFNNIQVNLDVNNTVAYSINSFCNSNALFMYMLNMYDTYFHVHDDTTLLKRDRIAKFPNIFLIRCDNDINEPEYRFEHQKPIYFLKYLILLYLERQSGVVDVRRLYEIFCQDVNSQYYDERVVRLVLGSLSATNESNCIDLHFKNKNDLEVTLSKRGKKIMSKYSPTNIPYCFSFQCLQLFFQDYLLLRPRKERLIGFFLDENEIDGDEINKRLIKLSISGNRDKDKLEKLLSPLKDETFDFGYLLEDDYKKYVSNAKQVIYGHAKQALLLLCILKQAMEFERNSYRKTWSKIWESIKNNPINDTLSIFDSNFFEIASEQVVISASVTYEKLSGQKIENALNEYRTGLNDNKFVFERFFKKYGEIMESEAE